MKARITPSALCGAIDAPSAKSDAHRLLICAALSDAPVRIENAGSCDDVRATMQALSALGAKFSQDGDGIVVTPVPREGKSVGVPTLDCIESGSTLRFLLPVAAVLRDKTSFTARGGLRTRPLAELLRAMEPNGASADRDTAPLTLSGRLQSGTFAIRGDVSSQYISGLLFALPLLSGDSRIVLLTALSSAGYVDMTLDALSRFGVRVKKTEDGFFVPGDQIYHGPSSLRAEGDWSGAAFALCGGALSGPVTVRGLRKDSLQRDKKIADVLKNFGADVDFSQDAVTVRKNELRGIALDADEIPDLVPIIAAVAAFARGATRIENCARLRIKETDRLETVRAMISSLGGNAEIDGDALVIAGGGLSGGAADSFGDHRIAMAAAIAASHAEHNSTIDRAEAVAKSYPQFFRDYQTIGGQVDGI